MKKSFLILAAILGAAFISCQKESNFEQSEPELTGKTYTLTMEATKAADTKGLVDDGTHVVTSWAATDEVKVCKHGSATPIGTLTPSVAGSATASLSGIITLTDVNIGDKLDLIFPDTNWTYENQDGTIETIATSYDFARAEVTVNDINGSTLVASDATFTNEQSLVKFSLFDKDDNSLLDVNYLKISAASGKLVKSYEVSGDAYTPVYGDLVITPTSGPASAFYVALRNTSGAPDTYTLTAHWGSSTYYTFVKSGVTFANGHYRAINVKMHKETVVYTVAGMSASNNLFGTDWDTTNSDNDMVKQADGTYRKTYQLDGTEVAIKFKVVENHSWSNSWGGSGSHIDGDGNYFIDTGEITKGTLVITFDPSSGTVNAYIQSEVFTVAGSEASLFGNSWAADATANDMVKQMDDTYLKSYTITSGLVNTTIKFKVTQDHDWTNSWGATGSHADSDGNYQYRIPHTGILHISFDPVTHDIDVWMDDNKYSIVGDFNLWDGSANIMTEQADGTYKCTVENPGVAIWEYKAVLGECTESFAEWYGDGDNNYSYEVTSPCDLIFTFNPVTKAISVEESRVTLYFNIARSCNDVALLSTALNTLGWPGDYADASETINEKLYYKWFYPSSLVWGQTVDLQLIDKGNWGMDAAYSFTPSENLSEYYFYMNNLKVITEVAKSEVTWVFTSHFTGIDWSTVSWLGSNNPAELTDWKATSDADNLYFFFKIPTSAVAADRYIYSGYDTDNDLTNGGDAGGGIGTGYEARSLLFPFTTSGSDVVCKNGVDNDGHIQCPIGTTVSGAKVTSYGEIKTDYAFIEMMVPRDKIGSPATGVTIKTNHSYHWYVSGAKALVVN